MNYIIIASASVLAGDIHAEHFHGTMVMLSGSSDLL